MPFKLNLIFNKNPERSKLCRGRIAGIYNKRNQSGKNLVYVHLDVCWSTNVPVYKQEKVIWEYIYFRVIFQYQYHCVKNPLQNCMTACLYSSYTKYLFKTFLWVGGGGYI